MHRTTLFAAAAMLLSTIGITASASAQEAGEAPATEIEIAETDGLLAELDQLAETASEEESGLLLAQEQAGRGEFLEAIGTVERVLALHPKSQTGRLLHAVYLCQIDDLPGGAAELDQLKRKSFSDDLWAQAQTICRIAEGAGQ